MSSLFDIDETTEVVPKKKSPKLETKPETVSAEETSAVVEPKIVASIRKTVTKLLDINKIAKRSVIISKTMTKLFDAEESDLDAQYGSVNITIDTMVQDGDVQEITLLDENDNPIESVLFAKNLTLDVDFDSAPLPGTDEDEDDPTSGETRIPGLTDFDRELSEFASQENDLDPGFNVDMSDDKATLNDKVEMFAVVSIAGDNQTVTLVEDAIEAVHSQREAAKYEGVSSKIYGLIPVEVHTSLGFANSAIDAPSELEEDIAGIPDEDEEDGELNLDGPIGPDAEGDSASPSDSSVFDEEEPK